MSIQADLRILNSIPDLPKKREDSSECKKELSDNSSDDYETGLKDNERNCALILSELFRAGY